jgi:hypothetical protein
MVSIIPPVLADEAADHAALRELKTLYERAVNENRLDLLAPHIGTPFHGVMITSKSVSTLEDMKGYWASMQRLMGPGGTYRVTLDPARSVILGDLALARGTTSDVVTTDEGRVYRFGTNWTATLQRQDGVWKIVQVQGSMDPVGNAFVRSFIRESLMKYGAVIALLALVLGLAIGFTVGRRRAVRTAA